MMTDLNLGDILTFTGLIIAAITLFLQIRSVRRQIAIQTFHDYTRRFQEIIFKLPEEIHEAKFDLEAASPAIKSKILKIMRIYFTICLEEYHLHEQRMIDAVIWTLWTDGMRATLSKPAFTQAWHRLQQEFKYNTHFVNFINSLIKQEAE